MQTQTQDQNHSSWLVMEIRYRGEHDQQGHALDFVKNLLNKDALQNYAGIHLTDKDELTAVIAVPSPTERQADTMMKTLISLQQFPEALGRVMRVMTPREYERFCESHPRPTCGEE